MVMKRSRVCTEPELQTDLVLPVDAIPPLQDASKGEGIVDPPLNLGEFLKTCYYCKKLIAEDEEVFMYRDFCGFCSVKCRERQIVIDNQLVEKKKSNSKNKVKQHKGMGDLKRAHISK